MTDLSSLPDWRAAFAVDTHSQIEQERWALAMCLNRRGGRFAEIGAFDGVLHSNTFCLERDHGWSGVLVEPNPSLFERIGSRRSATALRKAVHDVGGQTLSFVASAEIGTLAAYAGEDRYAEDRRRAAESGGLITVETISFDEMAAADGRGGEGFDYISLDTEGSELDILRSIDFGRHAIALFTVEHNGVEPRRSEMRNLLAGHGYEVLPVGFDDWFWHPVTLECRNGGALPDIAAIHAHVKAIYRD